MLRPAPRPGGRAAGSARVSATRSVPRLGVGRLALTLPGRPADGAAAHLACRPSRPSPPLLPPPSALPPPSPYASLDDSETAANIVDDKELSRRYRRTWFGHDDWRAHRSTNRYVRHLTSLPGSRIVRSLGPPLLWVVVAGVATGAYETARGSTDALAGLPSIAIGAQGAAQLSGFALSLLLAARTTNSYARWLDAVTAVGTVNTRVVDFTRQLAAWVSQSAPAGEGGPGSQTASPSASDDDAGALLSAAAARWAAALPRALAAHVREDLDLPTVVEGVLTPDEAAALAAAPHPPRFALQALTEVAHAAYARGRLTDGQAARLDEGLTAAGDAVGVCERIFHMPLPLSSTRHNSRVLMLALTFLPAVLWPESGWSAIPAAVLVSFLLLGIEEVGVSIEEPLSILPLEQLWCETDTQLACVAQGRAAARHLVARSVAAAGVSSSSSSSPAASDRAAA